MAISGKKESHGKEITALSICAFFWVGGLALCVLGVYAFNGPGKISDNPIFQAQKGFTSWLNWSRMVDFRILGSVICLLSMAIFLAFTYYYANKYDHINERKAHQIDRLKELIAKDKAEEMANNVSNNPTEPEDSSLTPSK